MSYDAATREITWFPERTPIRSVLLRVDDKGSPAYYFKGQDGKDYTVIITKEPKADGKNWLHVSVAGKNKMPPYEVMKEVKDLFIGKDLYAIAIMPPEAEYVNIHDFCWHWWTCLDGHPLPPMHGKRADLGLEKTI